VYEMRAFVRFRYLPANVGVERAEDKHICANRRARADRDQREARSSTDPEAQGANFVRAVVIHERGIRVALFS
jgi:hypothetical protein